ncbi:MAG: alpha/beta hydrolase [Cylindrospermopsis raciborskii KL1]|nr:alpha/beta hydrolase [Cylindrospermopsis raciborskii KL1]
MKSLFGNFPNGVRKNSFLLLLSMLLPSFSIGSSATAAEKIYVNYSILEIPISVPSLEKYTKTGVLDNNLSVYQNSLQQLQDLKRILSIKIRLDPSTTKQFLHTLPGEFILQRLAKIITNKSGESTSQIENLRTAIVAASAQPEGLTLLNLVKNYPGYSVNIDLDHGLYMAKNLERLINQTNQAIAIIQEQSKKEAANIRNLSLLPDLQNQGNFTVKKSVKKFFDTSRNRQLLTDIYIPESNNSHQSIPVIIISHGLGLDSSNFRYLAKHLASHGLAVIVPNHPDVLLKKINLTKLEEAKELINRPLDIKYILDELEKIDQVHTPFQGKLNLQQVGVFGQSLGGYTALALAGAKINFQQLKNDCTPNALTETWNMSLLLQCRALELPNNSLTEQQVKLKLKLYGDLNTNLKTNLKPNLTLNLRDDRIKAVIAVNPLISSIFGEDGLNEIATPVMLISSSQDAVSPALYEQILPFSWLNKVNKFLVMLVGGTHFSSIGNSEPGSEQILLPRELTGDTDQAHTYINTLSLPFFQSYVWGRPQYLPYLNAAYAQKISRQSLGLTLIRFLKTPQLLPLFKQQAE